MFPFLLYRPSERRQELVLSVPRYSKLLQSNLCFRPSIVEELISALHQRYLDPEGVKDLVAIFLVDFQRAVAEGPRGPLSTESRMGDHEC